jgi:glucose-6-phosphate isomerase
LPVSGRGGDARLQQGAAPKLAQLAENAADPTAESFALLAAHRARLDGVSMRRLFADDPARFNRFSARVDDLLLDYSKNRIDQGTMEALLALAEAANVAGWRADMFDGKAVNPTEKQAALHVALRAAKDESYVTGGRNVVPEVHAVLDRMTMFAEGIRSGAIKGHRGGRFTDVVNIGIGGSDLGPKMATRALAAFHDGPRVHYLSNVEGSHIADTLAGLDPATTLFLVASKTFTTIETMANARSARKWIADALGEAAVSAHFAAMSAANQRAAKFGVSAERVFPFWDWVGGRYSVWSSIGLPLMIAIGPENFRLFLSGARAMDHHFRDAPFRANLPVILALIGLWYRNLWGYSALAVVPYDQRLEFFPTYLQQLDMESNGKSVQRDGSPVTRPTGVLVWGEAGTNSQHAFFQLLHQGTDVIPCDFLAAIEGTPGFPEHQTLTLASCLAQSEAMMLGKSREEVESELVAGGMSRAEAQAAAPHREFLGNRPSNTVLYRRLDPFTLGRLMAIYEHKVFVQAVVWGINPFDQWGVELGKQLASQLVSVLEGKNSATGRDSSTAGLVAAIRKG